MDRVLCVLLCIVVMVVAVCVLACCGEQPEEPIVTTAVEPTMVTEPSTEATEPPTEVTEPPVEVTEATEETTLPPTEPPVVLYDVPLEEDLQLHIIQLCESYGIDPAIVMAMIWKESRFHTGSIGDNGNSFGLMQIQPRWHSGLMEQLGCTDLFDPYQNVTVGIAIFSSHMNRYDGNVGMALTAYNAGASGANKYYFSKGVYASQYATSIMAYADDIR